MRYIFAALLFASPAAAQQAFVPFTIDAAKYAEIDAAIAKLNMPRDAHAAWISLWQGIEQQAQAEARRAEAAAKAAAQPPAADAPK